MTPKDQPPDALSLAVERLNQAVNLITEQMNYVREERAQLHEAIEVSLGHLEKMKEHWGSNERVTAAIARMEGELRETLAEGHRLVDKMPGKRHY